MWRVVIHQFREIGTQNMPPNVAPWPDPLRQQPGLLRFVDALRIVILVFVRLFFTSVSPDGIKP